MPKRYASMATRVGDWISFSPMAELIEKKFFKIDLLRLRNNILTVAISTCGSPDVEISPDRLYLYIS